MLPHYTRENNEDLYSKVRIYKKTDKSVQPEGADLSVGGLLQRIQLNINAVFFYAIRRKKPWQGRKQLK